MVAQPWRFQYNGLLLGDGSDFVVETVEGLDDYELRSDAVAKGAEHGSFIYSQFLTERRITLTGKAFTPTNADLETALDDFRGRLGPVGVILPLIFSQPGAAQRRIYCLPIRSHVSMNRYRAHAQFVEWATEFLGGDPRVYADAASQLVGSGAAVNAGTFPTYPLVEIDSVTGNVAINPRITNDRTREYVQANVEVPIGTRLTLDFGERTITLGTTSRYDALEAGSTWWDLDPGSSTLTYSGGGTATTTWRSAWL